jgi:hypothetical protein
MASDAQIAANRANAMRSTGPRTAAGKQKSSRNAYRHGLAQPEPPDPSLAAQARQIASVLVDDQAAEDRIAAANNFAAAEVQISRIQSIRAEHWGRIDLEGALEDNTKELKRLASLDRYERYEFAKRRKAAKSLRPGH